MYSSLFKQLCAVQQLAFSSQSRGHSQMGWNHSGTGQTAVTVEENCVYFTDSFVLDNGRTCTDKKLWHFAENGIDFCHFREQKYTHIFTFVWQNGQFQALAPYGCPPDQYFGELHVQDGRIVLSIRIQGTRKDEHIVYTYQ